MVRVANGWHVGSWGRCCRVAAEAGEVAGRIGCVVAMLVGSGGCCQIAEVVEGYECAVGAG
jgi:hypothetical protein